MGLGFRTGLSKGLISRILSGCFEVDFESVWVRSKTKTKTTIRACSPEGLQLGENRRYNANPCWFQENCATWQQYLQIGEPPQDPPKNAQKKAKSKSMPTWCLFVGFHVRPTLIGGRDFVGMTARSSPRFRQRGASFGHLSQLPGAAEAPLPAEALEASGPRAPVAICHIHVAVGPPTWRQRSFPVDFPCATPSKLGVCVFFVRLGTLFGWFLM